MDIKGLLNDFGKSEELQKQAVFTSIFIIQNRLQTACDKLEDDITVKQWLLLAMASVCHEPPTLTTLGRLMGCSRQNVKKLAGALEKKGYLQIDKDAAKGNTASIIITAKTQEYYDGKSDLHEHLFRLLFQDFSSDEIMLVYGFIKKFYKGVSRIEKLAERVSEE